MCLQASRVRQHISALPVAAVTSVPTQQALPPRTVPCVAPPVVVSWTLRAQLLHVTRVRLLGQQCLPLQTALVFLLYDKLPQSDRQLLPLIRCARPVPLTPGHASFGLVPPLADRPRTGSFQAHVLLATWVLGS